MSSSLFKFIGDTSSDSDCSPCYKRRRSCSPKRRSCLPKRRRSCSPKRRSPKKKSKKNCTWHKKKRC